MDLDREIKLVQLTKKLSGLDRQIAKEINERGHERDSIRMDFVETQSELKEILLESGPLDEIRDPETRDILRKVMKGNLFIIDKRNAELEELYIKYPEIVRKILEDKGVVVSDLEIDKERIDTYARFRQEMVEKIDVFEYFEKKEKFGPIIVNNRLPKAIHTYFYHVKECFLFDQMFAVIGLCRVLLEVGFKDKHQKLGLRRSTQKVSDIKDYTIKTIIREVCSKLHLKIYSEVIELYDTSSHILHGIDPKMEMTTDNVLNFIGAVFGVIEKLYEK